jgi:glycosyltransferase involved in cell wall biosynthesis
MKIVYIITRNDEWGGAQVHVRDLAVCMHGQGHDVTVISGASGVVSDDLKSRGIPCHEIPAMGREINPLDDIKSILACRRLLVELKPDLVTCHSSKAGIIGRIAAALTKTPCIFTAHNWTFGKGVSWKKRPLYWLFEWIGARLCDHIIAVSQFGKTQALKAMIANDHKIIAIHNGMPDIEPAPRDDYQGPVRLMMIARIGWPKDHEGLLNALSLIRDLNWSLSFVGGGDSSGLTPIIQKQGLVDPVRFLGQRSDVAALLAKDCDIFILTSAWEGFPLSILEAMRASRPVIANRVGGVSESVHNGITGFTVEYGDTAALAQKLRELILDKEKREDMGQQGRKKFLAQFTFDHMATRTLQIYNDVLSKRQGSQ